MMVPDLALVPACVTGRRVKEELTELFRAVWLCGAQSPHGGIFDLGGKSHRYAESKRTPSALRGDGHWGTVLRH